MMTRTYSQTLDARLYHTSVGHTYTHQGAVGQEDEGSWWYSLDKDAFRVDQLHGFCTRWSYPLLLAERQHVLRQDRSPSVHSRRYAAAQA